MDTSVYTVAQQINDSSAQRPHLVILGAGASVQACPDGDRWGNKLPVMDDLIEKLDLVHDLDSAGVTWRARNFEDVYGSIYSIAGYTDLVHKIETRVRSYFGLLELPDKPTIYDYLVLSLREKDVIATFNWDPFLFQACMRNHDKAPMPKVLFLHGCAIIGHCWEHKKQGFVGAVCPQCTQRYAPTRLLYPVADKDYVSDAYIGSQWKTLKAAMDAAFVLTIFGYGAPTTDKAAIDLMSIAWGRSEDRSLEEMEMIDIKNEDELTDTWDRFIHSHHYQTTDDYFESLLAKHPRRTCEAMWQSLVEARFREANCVEKLDTFDELWRWFEPLLAAERKQMSQ
jgi:hypothetical protein